MSGGCAGQLRVSFLLLRLRMIELRSVTASDDANPVTGARLRAAHASCGGARRNWRRELGVATIRRAEAHDEARRLCGAAFRRRSCSPRQKHVKPAGGEAQLAYVDVDVADRGRGEAAAPRRLLLGLGEPGGAVPIQAAVARYGSASSFLEWRQHGAARIARPPSAVVKRPRHLATVPDNGTVQLDRA